MTHYTTSFRADQLPGLFIISERRGDFIWVTRAVDGFVAMYEKRNNPYGFTNAACDVIDMFERYASYLQRSAG